MGRPLSRHDFLRLGAAAGATAAIAGCDAFSTAPSGRGSGTGGNSGKSGGSGSQNPKEAPILAKQVKSGDLPEVKKRLPSNPRMIDPIDQIGTYGGTWHNAIVGTDVNSIIGTVKYDPLVMWDRQWEKVVPNVVASAERSPDATEYSFTLREGLKWSDGEPLTTDDIMFWYEGVFLNKELTPVQLNWLRTGGKPIKITKSDDLSFKVTFAAPYALLLEQLADWDPIIEIFPAHYLKQFHKDYNPDVDTLVKKNKMPNWVELFYQKNDIYNNTELPTHRGWTLTTPLSTGERVVYDRNPYYFDVDSQGSQLPYIDRIIFDSFNDEQVLILRAAHGTIDMYHHDPISNLRNRPVLAKSAKEGDYQLWDMHHSQMNTMGICFNLTHPDPVKRSIYQNKDFRIGLSHAINRQQIIDSVYQRQGEPYQTAPRPEVPFYDSDDIAKQYTEYDLKKANEHLDKAGLTKRNSDGIRLGPDGKPIMINIMTQSRYFDMPDVVQLIKGTWAKVGIALKNDNLDVSLFGNRMATRNFECTTDIGEYGYKGMVLDPRWLFATAGSSFAPLWSNWYEGGTPKEEPPESMKQQAAIYHGKVEASPIAKVRDQGMKEIIEIARDEFWTMGISLPAKPVALVKNTFHNVEKNMWFSTSWPTPGPTNICQFWTEDK